MSSNWIERFRRPERRLNFLRQRTAAHIAMQIRAMRGDRGWSQADLARMSGLAQPQISRCERVGYGKQTISTLLKLAEAFDVGIDISFVSWGELWRRERKLATQPLSPMRFEEEARREAEGASSTVIDITDRLPRSTVTTVTSVGRSERVSRGTKTAHGVSSAQMAIPFTDRSIAAYQHAETSEIGGSTYATANVG